MKRCLSLLLALVCGCSQSSEDTTPASPLRVVTISRFHDAQHIFVKSLKKVQ